MSQSSIVTMPSDELSTWRVVGVGPGLMHPSRGGWVPSAAIFCLGLLATAGAATVQWHATPPATIVQTRIIVDGAAGGAGRAALSDLALRLATVPERPVTLEDGGNTLVVTERDHDPAQAWVRTRSLVDTVLNAAIGTAASIPQFASPQATVQTERTRLAAAADALQSRAGAISASLTQLTRDIAAASRDDHRPSRETLDKGNAALADLQLQRLQLASKYQDTYPAVIALDGQIRNLHVFLMDEAHRVDGRPATPDASDAMLTRERDRLRTELVQTEDRRKAMLAELDGLDHRLALAPATTPPPAIIAAALPPVLVAAATTSVVADDDRPEATQLLAAIGLALSAALALLVGRRRVDAVNRLVLEQVGGLAMMGHDHRVALSERRPQLATDWRMNSAADHSGR